MRVHHRVFAVALVAVAGAGCAARYECLTSHPASLASHASIRIARRELSRADGGSPAVRARIEKELPALFPDLSDRIDAPTCGPDLVDRLAEDLQRRPLLYGRDVFDEAEALGRVVDTVDVMGAKANVPLRLATIPDADLQPYRFAAGEQGPAPPPARLRYLALALLVHSNLFLNVSEVRRFLIERVRASTDEREQLLLEPSARQVFEESAPRGFDPSLAPSLARTWSDETSRRLQGPSDPVALELVLARITDLGAVAARIGMSVPVLALVRSVIDVGGELPVAHAVPGGARDLVVRAILAQHDVEHPRTNFYLTDPDWPRPARVPLDLAALALGDPAPIRWPDAVVAERLRDLDDELVLAREEERPVERVCWAHGDSESDDFYESGGPPGADCCWAVQQRAAWTPAANADAFFDALLEPREASTCAVAAALAIDAVASAKRAHVALATLGDPGAAAFSSPRAAVVAMALAAHPAWTDVDRALHEWIAQQALVERGDRGDGANNAASARNGDAWATLEPVFEHVIAEDASSSSPDVRARARATVAQWIEQVRAAQGVRFTSVSSARIPVARRYGVVALAPRVGLTEEVRALLDALGEDAAVARWLLAHPG